MSTDLAPERLMQADPHLEVFCGRSGAEVFSFTTTPNQVYTPDPFDVVDVHAEAREVFGRLVERAVASPAPASGKSLVLLGEAGSGKTHLMRAFRNRAHEDGTGYCGYLQMTTRSENYARYLLSNLIDALSLPYSVMSPTSGLNRLAGGLLDALGSVPAEQRERLRAGLDDAELPRVVCALADAAIQDVRFQAIDLDLLRAMFYLLADDARIRSRVLKWLRCEDLAPHDRALLGGLVPRPQEHMPLRTIVDLGRLMASVQKAALVLCVDQLEEMIEQTRNEKDPGDVFRRLTDTLVAVTEVIPTSVVVMACLEDYYKTAIKYLTAPKRDRLERDPEPIRLTSHRSTEEIAAILSRRLEVLYAMNGLPLHPENSVYPYEPEHLRPLVGLTTRDILDNLRRHRESCSAAGCWVDPDWTGPIVVEPVSLDLEQSWNDFVNSYQTPTLDGEGERTKLLAWVIRAVSDEMPHEVHFGAEPEDDFLTVDVHGSNNSVEPLLVALCDRSPRGGGLGHQLAEVERRAGDHPAVIVRSSPFPKGPNALANQQIARLVTPRGKGRKVEVESADWRAMASFQQFHAQHHDEPEFPVWQKRQRPLATLPSLRAILALDRLQGSNSFTAPQPIEEVIEVKGPKLTVPTEPLLLGTTRGAVSHPVHVDPGELTQHAAFLGGPGSGKTTAALTLMEQLLLRGVPAVLLDRKGDLARYADPAAWKEDEEDPNRRERRRQLQERIDVALYTPGAPSGRPLTLPIAPPDLGRLPEAEREQLCQYAAAALGGIMGYRARGIDPKLAILGKAIEVLASMPGGEISIRGLQQLIDEEDEALVTAVGGFESRHYRRLSEDLLALSLQRQRLLEGDGETLDLDTLLGRSPRRNTRKTRLAIINTQSLGGLEAVDFWMAQFFIAVGRWAARSPSPDGSLQVVFLLDEADLYMPATRQPATKGPLENLLRRARSAGVGLFLVTQNPGDFDYKCRDQVRLWLLGRVTEGVALGKLKAKVETGKGDVLARLPNQSTGEFYLVREREVIPINTERSLLTTAQLPETRILELARQTRKSAPR